MGEVDTLSDSAKMINPHPASEGTVMLLVDPAVGVDLFPVVFERTISGLI
jgi:hypothetical protein